MMPTHTCSDPQSISDIGSMASTLGTFFIALLLKCFMLNWSKDDKDLKITQDASALDIGLFLEQHLSPCPIGYANVAGRREWSSKMVPAIKKGEGTKTAFHKPVCALLSSNSRTLFSTSLILALNVSLFIPSTISHQSITPKKRFLRPSPVLLFSSIITSLRLLTLSKDAPRNPVFSLLPSPTKN